MTKRGSVPGQGGRGKNAKKKGRGMRSQGRETDHARRGGEGWERRTRNKRETTVFRRAAKGRRGRDENIG